MPQRPGTRLTLLALIGVIVLGASGAAAVRAVPATRGTDPQPFALRDDLKREVRFERRPLRLVTLLPSVTEIVCALGACERVVATDRYSNWPARVRTLPKAGGLDDASVELILSLRPDLVLLSRSQRITERLGDLGIQSFAMKTETYADIGRNIETLGRILAVSERASSLRRDIADEVARIAAASAAQRHGAAPTVYFEVDRAPYAAGPDSFIGELLNRLGTRNIVTVSLGPFPKLNPEYVVRHDPDVIFVGGEESPRLAERPGWDQIRAVREHRLCSFAAEVNDTIFRPGPRVADGMRALAECLARVAP